MATDWEVTSQRQVDELTQQGSFEPVMEVNFRTLPEHIPGQIKVPLRLYGAGYVRTEVDSAVAKIKAVQSL